MILSIMKTGYFILMCVTTIGLVSICLAIAKKMDDKD